MTTPKTARTIILDFMENSLNDKLKGCFNADTLKARIDFALSELAELVSVDSIEKELYLFNSKNQYTGFITTTRARTVYPIPHKRWMNPLAKTIHALITTKLGVKDEGRVLPLQAGHI